MPRRIPTSQTGPAFKRIGAARPNAVPDPQPTLTGVFIHPNALVEARNIGAGSRVWAFAHILTGAVIGVDANICDHVFIENGVRIGDRVTVKSGVQLWDGITIEDDVFIGPNATFTNDAFPRSKVARKSLPPITIRHHASVGANATVLPAVTIGSYAMVGAGAVVTRDVPPYAIVAGSPARIIGYAGTDKVVQAGADVDATAPHPIEEVAGCRLLHLPMIRDMRGNLIVGQVGDQLPFAPKRFFLVREVPSKEVRGEHAHLTLEQILVCIGGSCSILVDDGKRRAEVTLNDPQLALYVPPMVWSVQYRYTPDAVLLVLASAAYDSSDYLRTYEEFEQALSGRDR